jgi:hypothetical protein
VKTTIQAGRKPVTVIRRFMVHAGGTKLARTTK